ncbi:hypothetical protein ABT124_44090 [Streptomyces sp. NPDC001982]|uniref:hypothetical protein n=1 Tax=Streptomyces sp. NPDC001982 TaxID=3154405 RepID=UPI0033332C7E
MRKITSLRDVLRRGPSEEDFDPSSPPTVPPPWAHRRGVATAVLDIGLPDADGRNVCQAMRANGFHAPVAFLSTRHQVTNRRPDSPPAATTICPNRASSPNSPPACQPRSDGPPRGPRPRPTIWSWTRSGTARPWTVSAAPRP